ncbi:MAG: tetratricopeptide repeat protein, partial [Ignavibacteria bacterium]|nr:tetratricopeptide repeat protein [Ignavibacteria bacterium]
MNKNIHCTICGEMLSENFAYCPGCGSKNVKYVHAETDTTVKGGSAKHDDLKKNKQSKKHEVVNKSKSVSTLKLVYIGLFLLVIASVILVLSGIFDSTGSVQATTDANTNANANNPHAGVDLNQLEQITELQKTVDSNPGNLEALLNLAHLLNDSGFKDKAIERYEQYLKQNSKAADVWVDMGVCYFELGKNSEAISKMEKALTIEPKHQIAHLNLGIVNLSSGNKENALSWWKKALEINPTSEIGKRAEELINQH